MEQIYNGVLEMARTMADRQASAAEKNNGSENGRFQELLESKRASLTEEDRAEAAAGGQKETQDNSPALKREELDLELRTQMAWAALTVMQSPAAPVEQAMETAPEQALCEAAPLLAADPAELAEARSPQTAAQTVELDTAGMAEEQWQPLQPEAAQTAAETPEAGKKPEGEPVAYRAELSRQSEEPEQGIDNGAERTVFPKLQEIPVKVGEALPQEGSGEARPVETQLSEGLNQALRNGETRVELHLEPESLGKVQVELTWSRDGELRVSLYAESSHTRSLLERELSGLQAVLSREARQEVRVEVARQQESQQQNLNDGREGGHQNGRQQQEQRQGQRQQNEVDFLHQLRLGLIPLSEAAS